MTTLSKRATPRQAQVMRMVEGACRNAIHSHPELNIPERFARSVAKRAAGTLTSAWGSVLAVSAVRSEDGSFTKSFSGCSCHLVPTNTGGVAHFASGAALILLRTQIEMLAAEAMRYDEVERHEAFAEVLELMGYEV